MKPSFSSPYSTRPSSFAKQFTALACIALLCSPLCSVVGRAQQSYEDTIIDQLSGVLQDTERIKLDGITSASLLQSILNSQGIYSSDLSTILSDLNSLYRISYNNLGYLNRLPDIKDLNTEQVRLLKVITNLLPHVGGTDVLAGNPWWATNSQFTSWNASFGDVFPQDPSPTSNYQQSFPEAFSGLLAQLYPYTANRMVSRTGWVDQWGWSRQLNTQLARGRSYTWFDWMSDATRSNWVLQATSALTSDAPTSDLTAVTSAVDDGSTDVTNRIPDMVVDQMDVTGVEASLDLVDADAVGAMLPASYTGGNPEFVVFSGGLYGDVTVPEVRGSLALPENVARYLHGVAKWLWRVALFVGCFVILRQEVAYWSTLGGSASDA